MTATASFPYESSLHSGTADVVAQFFHDLGAVGTVAQLMDGAIALVEHITADMFQQQPPPQPLACAKGCNHCCHGYEVHVSPLEVLSLVEYIATHFPEADIEALLGRTLDTQEAKEVHTPDEKPLTNFACPLNHEGACQVYAVRPLTCRAFNSYDADACKRRKIDGDAAAVIEGYVHPHRISLAVHNGLQEGLARAGLNGYLLDLTPALLIALTNPDARTAWLAGEDAFAQAHIRLTNA